MIQACQECPTSGVGHQTASGQSDPAIPPQAIDQERHIVLDRPHTVLLLATVTGGVALRGAFTGAIAEAFRKADGKIDICEMFHEAVNSMSNDEQIPEMRVTTRKLLILPPANNYNSSGDEEMSHEGIDCVDRTWEIAR